MARIIGSLLLAFAVAAALIFACGLHLPGDTFSDPWSMIAMNGLRVAAFAFPVALCAVMLGEVRRIRGVPYWVFAGLLTGILGSIWLAFTGAADAVDWKSAYGISALAVAGVSGGIVYWFLMGKNSGRLTAAIDRQSEESSTAGHCIFCTVAALALLVVPVAIAGWVAIYEANPDLPATLQRRAEAEANARLARAGLPSLSLKIQDDVGVVNGMVANSNEGGRSFEIATKTLAPFVGLAGVVARLRNGIEDDTVNKR